MKAVLKLLSRLPPPLLFVLPFVVGSKLERLIPMSARLGGAATALHVVGWALVVLGLTVMASAIGLFARRRTTIIPHGRASSLVSAGPFGWSRNPMYVGSTILYLGACAVTGTVWPLALLPVPLLLLQLVVIPMEERSMAEVFGADYAAYADRVRRWV